MIFLIDLNYFQDYLTNCSNLLLIFVFSNRVVFIMSRKFNDRGGGYNRGGKGRGNNHGGYDRGGGGGYNRRGGGNNYNNAPREMHDAKCSDCGAPCQVPFVPTEGKPVYCRDCYQNHKKSRY